MATNQFAINMTRLLAEEGVSAEHTSRYFGVKGLCYLNGVDESLYSSFLLDLGARPLFSDFCAKWVASSPWEFSQDVFSVTHTCIDGDWNKILIHIDIRYIGDQRKKVRRRQFVSDITGYLLSQGLMNPGVGESQHFEIYIGEDSDYGRSLSYFRGTNILKTPGQTKSPLYTDENIGIWLETAESIFGEICPWVDWDEDMVTNEYVRYTPFGNTVNHYYDRDGFCYLNLVTPEERAIYDSYCGSRPTLEIFLKFWHQEGANKDEIFALTWHTIMGSDTQYMIHVDRHFGDADPRFRLRVNNMQVDLQRFIRVSGLFGELCNGNSDVRIGGKKFGPGCTGKMQCKCDHCDPKPEFDTCTCGMRLTKREISMGDTLCKDCYEDQGAYGRAEYLQRKEQLRASWRGQCDTYNRTNKTNLGVLEWFRLLIENNEFRKGKKAVLTHDAAVALYQYYKEEMQRARDRTTTRTTGARPLIVAPTSDKPTFSWFNFFTAIEEPSVGSRSLQATCESVSDVGEVDETPQPQPTWSTDTTPIRVASPKLTFGDAPPTIVGKPVVNVLPEWNDDGATAMLHGVTKRLERWVPPTDGFVQEELGGVMDDREEELRENVIGNMSTSAEWAAAIASCTYDASARCLALIKRNAAAAAKREWVSVPNWRSRFFNMQGSTPSYASVVKGAPVPSSFATYKKLEVLAKTGQKVLDVLSCPKGPAFRFQRKRYPTGAVRFSLTLAKRSTDLPPIKVRPHVDLFHKGAFDLLEPEKALDATPETVPLSYWQRITSWVSHVLGSKQHTESAKSVRKGKVPKLVDYKYAEWLVRCENRKAYLRQFSSGVTFPGRFGSRTGIPETVGLQRQFINSLDGSLTTHTVKSWQALIKHVQLHFSCPIKGFKWNLCVEDGYVEILEWSGSGVSVTINDVEFTHLGLKQSDLEMLPKDLLIKKYLLLQQDVDTLKQAHRLDRTTQLQDERDRLAVQVRDLLRAMNDDTLDMAVSSSSAARTNIFASYTSTMHWFMGYRLTMHLGFTNVHTRKLDYTRPVSDRDPSLITNRQSDRFWPNGSLRLVFTLKGIAKMYYEKPIGSKWRKAIATSLGLTMSAADRKLKQFTLNQSVPDLVSHTEDETFPYRQPEVEKEVPVYIEVPAQNICQNCQSLPTRPSTGATLRPSIITEEAEVNHGQTVPEKMSNVTTPQDSVMTQDTQTLLDSLITEQADYEQLVDDVYMTSGIYTRSSDELALSSNHEDARDSTKSDIELNPGPDSSNELTVEHTTPVMLEEAIVRHIHRRAASEFTLDKLRKEHSRIRTPSFSRPGRRNSSKVGIVHNDSRPITPVEQAEPIASPNSTPSPSPISLKRRVTDLADRIKAASSQMQKPEEDKAPTNIAPMSQGVSAPTMAKDRSAAFKQFLIQAPMGGGSEAMVNPPPSRRESKGKTRLSRSVSRVRSKSKEVLRRVKATFKDDSEEESPRSMKQAGLRIDTGIRGRPIDGKTVTSATPSGMEEESVKHKERSSSIHRSISRVRATIEHLKDKATDMVQRASSRTRSPAKDPSSILRAFQVLPDYRPVHTVFDIGRKYMKCTAYRLPFEHDLSKTWPVRWVSAGAFHELQKSLDRVQPTGSPFSSRDKHILFKFILGYLNQAVETSNIENHVHLTGSDFSAMAHMFKTAISCPVGDTAYAIDIRAAEKIILFYEGSDAPECQNRLWWLMDGYATVHGGSREDRLADYILERMDPSEVYQSGNDKILLDHYDQMWFRHPLRTGFMDHVQVTRRVPVPVNEIRMYYAAHGSHLCMNFMKDPSLQIFGTGGISYKKGQDQWPTDPSLRFAKRWHLKTKHRMHHFVKHKIDRQLNKNINGAFHMPARFYILIYFWFLIATIYLEYTEAKQFINLKYFRPEFKEPDRNVRVVTSDESHSKTHERLLIAKMGTRGDQVPLDYAANVASSFGVPVDTLLYQSVTSEELHNLRYGEMLPILPTYLELMHSGRSRYKRVFVPQVEVEKHRGLSYTLAPSRKWIQEPTFVKSWKTVTTLNKPFAYVATVCFQLFKPTMRIGALSDSHFPRSVDGLKPLTLGQNRKRGLEGWDTGSAPETIIPDYIKERAVRVPKGDHSDIFLDYDVVHTHGGAGTVQTIVAAGATPVIWDRTLDRKYHTIPTQADIKTPSISFFMGWLVASGFKINAPVWIKSIWYLTYKSFTWKTDVVDLSWTIIKIYIMAQGFYKNHLSWLILATSVPPLLWRFLVKDRNLFNIIGYMLYMLWTHPLLFVLPDNPFFVIPYVLLQESWVELMQDLSNYMRPKKYVVFTPLDVRDVPFKPVWPIGHYFLWDKEKDRYYEGRFRYANRRTIDDPFKMVEVDKPVIPSNSKYFRAPWSEAELNDLLCEDYRPYGMTHNCATLVLRATYQRSVIFSIVFAISIGCIAFLFSPGRVVKAFFENLRPHVSKESWENMWIISVLGFAAGADSPIEPTEPVDAPDISQVPLNEPEDVPPGPEPELEPEIPDEVKKSREQDVHFLMKELALIIALIKSHMGDGTDDHILDDDDLHDAAMNVLGEVLTTTQFPQDAMRRYESLPYAPPTTYEAVIDELHAAMSFLRKTRFTKAFVNFLKSIVHNIEHFLQPVLRSLAYIFDLAIKHSQEVADRFFIAVSKLLDKIWGLEASRRIKTVWGLTGLYRTGVLGAKAQMDREIVFSNFIGKTDFETDYENFISRIKSAMSDLKYEVDEDKIGGPQRRPVRYKRPFGNKEWAKILGFKEGDYDTTAEYEERIMSYLAEGVQQGVDGVHYADRNPEKLQQSTDRYAPRYPLLDADSRARAQAVADTMFKRWPEVFANANTSRPEAVIKYIKQKYSPGIPFIKQDGYRTREAMFKAGFDKAIKKLAIDSFKSGIYPVKFYQSFGKAQVVDGKALLPVEAGGKDKNVRTIVAQDLFTMVQDQVFQLERNKRATWDTYGMGSGMPLNQTMGKIFERMQTLKKRFGGNYLNLDATEFDSRLTAFSAAINTRLWERGFEGHKSGNGAAFASQLAASYVSKQDAYIIGITEPEYESLTIAVEDSRVRKFIERKFPDTIVPLATLVDWPKYRNLSKSKREEHIRLIRPPPGKVVLSWKAGLKPGRSNFMGKFEFGDLEQAKHLFFNEQTFRYAPGNWEAMVADVKRITKSNFPLVSNMHPKLRGAGTGEGDTSHYNTHSFRGVFIDAVCETKEITPDDFFVEMEENSEIFKEAGGTKINNTSDDSITWSGGIHGLVSAKDIHKFQEACRNRGVWLKLTKVKKITDVEYLSKLVRPPSKQDSEELEAWKKTKIAYIANREKQMGMATRSHYEELNPPKLLVYQNAKAILLRRSAFRYYQSSYQKYKYVSAERGAGHAMNTAFCPTLYNKFAVEWCDDVNSILAQRGIHGRYAFKSKAFSNLPGVVLVDDRFKRQSLSPRQMDILKWLEQNKYPTYWKVIDVHMNIGSTSPTKHNNLMRKLNLGWRGWDQILREGVDWLFMMTDAIPDSWSKKFQPSIDMLYAEPTFYTHNCYTETFVYLKLLKEYTDSEISFSMFNDRLMESPYAGTCDPYAFWHKLKDPVFRQTIIDSGQEKYQGMVFLISLLYACTSFMEMYVIYQIPVIAQLYQLYMWTFIGLNKVYGLSNTMYWHSTGKSSRVISRLMPRDPYIVSKRACAFLIDLFPASLGYTVFVPLRVLDLFPIFLEAFAKFWYVGFEIKNPESKTTTKDNPWLAYTSSYLQALRESPTKAVYIDAKTSTGKSSYFVAAINHYKEQHGFKKIWVLEPTRILHANVSVPFQPSMQYLNKGVRLDPSADIYVSTYGHARMGRIGEIGPNDVVLFDEFHKLDGDILLALEQIQCYKFLLSATTVDISFLQGSPYFKVPIEQRHPTTIYQMEEDMDVVQMYHLAHQRHEQLCDRALIIVPTKKMAQQAKEALSYKYKGFCDFTVVSKDQRIVPDHGCIIATPYVETGVDMKPPAKILIDSGITVKIDRGKFVHPLPKTDKDSNTQRIGRVGRLQEGIVYQNPGAGEGPDTVTYPSTTFFQYKCVADHFKVPQLGVSTKPRCNDLPFLHINTSKLTTISIEKSVVLIHALGAQGLRPLEWERQYNDIKIGKPLNEEKELLRRVVDSQLYRGVPLLNYSDAQYHLNRYGTIGYEFANGDIKWALPMHPVEGRWYEMELEDKPHRVHQKLTNKWLKEHTDAIERRQLRLKNAVLNAASSLPENIYNRFKRDVDAL
nr:polyprotein [Sclerotinia sclerotiorum hypovirus 9]